MGVLDNVVLGYVAFAVSAVPISFAAWPNARIVLRTLSSLILGAILFLFNSFVLITSPAGVTFGRLLLCSLSWLALGTLVYFGYVKRPRVAKPGQTPVGSAFAKFGLGNLLAMLAAALLLIAFIVIPVFVDLSDNLPWRFRAYMTAFASVVVMGVYFRKKAKTVLLGMFLIFGMSMLNFAIGLYPVGTPLLRAQSLVQEGTGGDVPLEELAVPKQASTMIARLALACDMVVLILAVCLLGVATVTLTKSLLARPAARTPLSLLAVFILLVPGLLIPYAYSLGVGTLEFGANLGLGASESFDLVRLAQKGEITNETISQTTAHLEAAGERFKTSEKLLVGLGKLNMFGFLSVLPIAGPYSNSTRCIAWALANAAIGLHTSALGALAVLEGALTIFSHDETPSIDSFDVLGPRLMSEKLDESLFKKGMLRIDSAFRQIVSGFPRIRSSVGNLSKVRPDLFEKNFPEISDGLWQLQSEAAELGQAMDAMEILMGSASERYAPATNFLFASYSLARISSSFTNLTMPEELPNMNNVVTNLSEVGKALENPTIRRIRSGGGNVGAGLSFLSDATAITQKMAALGENAKQVACGVEDIRRRFEETRVENVTEIELDEWDRVVTALAGDADDLVHRTQEIQNGLQLMKDRTAEKRYGYANDLAASSIELLAQAMNFLARLERLSQVPLALKSLIGSARSFKEFERQLNRLQRQTELENWDSARDALEDAIEQLERGRTDAEDALARLESVAEDIQPPVDRKDVLQVVDAAASIQGKLANLYPLISSGSKQQTLGLISAIRTDFSELTDRLRLSRAPV